MVEQVNAFKRPGLTIQIESWAKKPKLEIEILHEVATEYSSYEASGVIQLDKRDVQELIAFLQGILPSIEP